MKQPARRKRTRYLGRWFSVQGAGKDMILLTRLNGRRRLLILVQSEKDGIRVMVNLLLDGGIYEIR